MTSPLAGAARGERKLAVALFADLSGFTALCRELDPEDVALTVAPLMMLLRQAAEANGGVVANVAGDGFFVMFGVPVAFVDGPLRAIQAAQSMCQIVADRNAQPGLQRVPDVHVGVAAGEVLVTESDEPTGWSVIGNAVNLASRLCNAAGPGEVLVDDECRRLASDSILWAGSRNLQVRGHDADVVAWMPASATSVELGGATATIYVGRHAELSRLTNELDAATQRRQSRVVRITGQPGIGKTQLLAQWLRTVDEVPHHWLQCDDTIAGKALRDLLGLLADASNENAAEPVTTSPAAATNPSFAALQTDRFPLIVATVRRQITSIAAALPLVLVIDDVPRSDPSIAELIADIDTEPIDAPVLLVSTQRSDAAESAAGDIHLTPLDEQEIDELIDAIVGAPAPASVHAAIGRRAEGYPLMAVQSATYLMESGVVAVTDGRCEVLEPQAVESLPSTLRLFVEARLDGLPATEKSAIQQLSTTGDSVDEGWASLVLGRESRSVLNNLARRGMLREGANGHWRFSHNVVQEVAYSTLTRRARTDLHRRQLRLLGPDGPPQRRAFHALARLQTVSASDAVATAEAAIDAMRAMLAHGRELFTVQANSCHAALEPIRDLTEDYAHLCPSDAVNLRVLDAQCLIELGRFEAALRAATSAVGLANEHQVEDKSRARALLVRGSALSRLRRFESARQQLDEASAIAARLDDDSLRAQALYLTAQTWRGTLFSRWVTLTEAAYHLFVSAEDMAGAGDCARTVAYLHSVGPQARFDHWQALAASNTGPEDVRGQAWLERSVSMAAAARLDFDLAQSSATAAIDLGERAGAVDIVVDGLINSVKSLLMLGRVEEAIAAADRLTALAARQPNPRLQLLAATTLAHALLRGGQQARSREEIAVARQLLESMGSIEVHEAASAEAVVGTDAGRWHEAMAAFEEAETQASESGFVVLMLMARLERLRLAVMLGTAVDPRVFESLQADCTAAGAPLIASYVAAVCDLARLPQTPETPPSRAAPDACLEELATRHDTEALRAAVLGQDASERWAHSRELWQQLGYTVWLARAQARSGDRAAAEETLDLLDSPTDAREWALSGPG